MAEVSQLRICYRDSPLECSACNVVGNKSKKEQGPSLPVVEGNAVAKWPSDLCCLKSVFTRIHWSF